MVTTGYSMKTLDGQSLRDAIAALPDCIVTGAIRPPRYQTFPLEDAAHAHRLLERGGIVDRVLLPSRAAAE